MEAGIQTLHEKVGARIQQAMQSYASQQCEDQRKICADQILDESHDKDLQGMVDAIRESMLDAPEPPQL